MALIIIIALLVLGGIVLALRRPSRPAMREGRDYRFDSAPFEGLFGETGPEGGSGDRPGPAFHERIREGLLERAGQGDLQALSEARERNDDALYREVLAALVARAEACQERLAALVCHVVQNGNLRASTELAELMIENWEKTLGRNAVIDMMHVSALSDDSQTFQRAMDSAVSAWSAGRLDLSADELMRLIANEYWVLSPEARRSGESFLLKRRMSEVRRRLARRDSAANRPPDAPPAAIPARPPSGSNADEEGKNHE
ncbi:MAG TPA: hypothetical protein VNH22_08845 [Blastocatellia bacterium]|jgi:hypothetical protein|nr:hypothetical protein [Blastocatellia bacterium]